MKPTTLPIVGWREWLSLPALGVHWIKAKVDTGARTSSLHAFGLEVFPRRGVQVVRFEIHPYQRSSEGSLVAEHEMIEQRWVKSSGGDRTLRPVVLIDAVVMGQRWPIELTLTNRDTMGFRMLLGREAVRGRFLVNAGRSYLGGPGPARHGKKVSRLKKKKSKGRLK